MNLKVNKDIIKILILVIITILLMIKASYFFGRLDIDVGLSLFLSNICFAFAFISNIKNIKYFKYTYYISFIVFSILLGLFMGFDESIYFEIPLFIIYGVFYLIKIKDN